MYKCELKKLIVDMVMEVIEDKKDYSLVQEYGNGFDIIRTDETDEKTFLTIKSYEVLDFINFNYSKNEILKDIFNLYQIREIEFEKLSFSESNETVVDFLENCMTYISIRQKKDYLERVASNYFYSMLSEEFISEILKDINVFE